MNKTLLTAESTLDEILHAIISIGISAASIFVKNPKTQALASNIVNQVNTVVLPLADAMLTPTDATKTQ